MRFKNGPQLSGAGRTRAGHHHGSHTPASPEAILLGKMAHHTKQIRRECTTLIIQLFQKPQEYNVHFSVYSTWDMKLWKVDGSC